MTKLRKQRKKKHFRHNINRKRLRNKIFSKGGIGCKDIKDVWENNKSVKTNLTDMGLVFDPNKAIKIPNVKNKLKSIVEVCLEENVETEKPMPSKAFIAKKLEEDAKAPRKKLFRLPKKQVEWLEYLLDTYKNDYKAMERDKRNYKQETWRQLKAKIKRFKSIPEQYSKYLEKRGLNDDECSEVEDSD